MAILKVLGIFLLVAVVAVALFLFIASYIACMIYEEMKDEY